MTQAATEAVELDPRSPRARLTKFFDNGEFTLITPEDDRGVVSAVGRTGDGATDLAGFRGLGRTNPVLALAMTVLLLAQAGVRMNHIPYKGANPALVDLVGGHVAIYFSSMPPALGLIKEGKVRALAVTGPKRSDIMPELPTVAEAGDMPGFEAVLHYGIVAPAGTPTAIVNKLNIALRAAVMSDELKAKLAADGTEPLASTPEEYAADIDKEETKWSAIVRKSGAKAE